MIGKSSIYFIVERQIGKDSNYKIRNRSVPWQQYLCMFLIQSSTNISQLIRMSVPKLYGFRTISIGFDVNMQTAVCSSVEHHV